MGKTSRKKRRAAAIRKASDLEIKAVKDAVDANKAAVKAYLKEFKATHSKAEYKAKSDFYNRQLKQNDKWAKLKVAHLEAENKHETLFSVGAVDGRVSKFYAWRLGRASSAANSKVEKVENYLYALERAESRIFRVEQIQKRDLSFVVMHEWENIPQTTVEDVKRELLEREAAVQQTEESRETVERESERIEPVRQRVDYQREVESHIDGLSQTVAQNDALESERSVGSGERVSSEEWSREARTENSELSAEDLELE